MAATWLMMAVEGPFLAAVIARLGEPKYNLAAWGVAYAFAMLFEAPVIMMLSASTALVEDADSFRRLRAFAYALNAMVTVVMLIALVPSVFDFIAESLIDLPPRVAELTRGALILLLPWPAAIGYRRFFQGLLIRDGLTRRVALGTIVRLVTMSSTAATLSLATGISGAHVGAAALAAGVSAEAVVSRLMAQGSVRDRLATTRPAGGSEAEPLFLRRILQFYYPLALTSLLSLAVYPMITFFMGRARFAVESLAVLPVVNSLVFIFRSMGLSYQEVAIALMGPRYEDLRELGRFALGLALAASLGLALVGFTPLAHVWFITVSGLDRDLTSFAITATRILAVLPALSVLLSFQRAILVRGRHTRPITAATAIEVGGIVLALMVLIHGLDLVGVTAAAIAYVVGRLGSNTFLVPPCASLVRTRASIPDGVRA